MDWEIFWSLLVLKSGNLPMCWKWLSELVINSENLLAVLNVTVITCLKQQKNVLVALNVTVRNCLKQQKHLLVALNVTVRTVQACHSTSMQSTTTTQYTKSVYSNESTKYNNVNMCATRLFYLWISHAVYIFIHIFERRNMQKMSDYVSCISYLKAL